MGGQGVSQRMNRRRLGLEGEWGHTCTVRIVNSSKASEFVRFFSIISTYIEYFILVPAQHRTREAGFVIELLWVAM